MDSSAALDPSCVSGIPGVGAPIDARSVERGGGSRPDGHWQCLGARPTKQPELSQSARAMCRHFARCLRVKTAMCRERRARILLMQQRAMLSRHEIRCYDATPVALACAGARGEKVVEISLWSRMGVRW